MSRTAARLQSPLAYAAVGASILAVPASAAALVGAAQPNGSGTAIKAMVKRRRIEYGGEVVVVGDAPASERGQRVTLQYASATSHGWRQVASERIQRGGHFRLTAWLRSSGWLKATTAPSTSATSLGFSADAASTSSTPLHVAVAAAIRVRPHAINELDPRTVVLSGRLLPSKAGSRVRLQAERSGRWITKSIARTGSGGWFRLRYRPGGLGRVPLRVAFAGDSTNAGTSRSAGSVTVYQPTVASWYYDGGTTACGFHAYYGVANLSLPCGTPVSLYYGDRVVRAVVDDRGPYVGGRTWDLNQNTAAALGMFGVGTVWSSR